MHCSVANMRSMTNMPIWMYLSNSSSWGGPGWFYIIGAALSESANAFCLGCGRTLPLESRMSLAEHTPIGAPRPLRSSQRASSSPKWLRRKIVGQSVLYCELSLGSSPVGYHKIREL